MNTKYYIALRLSQTPEWSFIVDDKQRPIAYGEAAARRTASDFIDRQGAERVKVLREVPFTALIGEDVSGEGEAL